MPDRQNILVIKLGALGDFIQALGIMRGIRDYHKDARITLLTTAPFAALAQQSGYFDAVLIDKRPRWFDIKGWLDLRKTLIQGAFDRVYDLQNNDRTNLYFKRLFPVQKPEWVGIAKGASHRNTDPSRIAGPAWNGHVQTLALAGITDLSVDRLEWMTISDASLMPKEPYILLVPGSSTGHLQKRWPAAKYGALAKECQDKGIKSVILGTTQEKNLADEILMHCPQAIDLTGRTALTDLPDLARHARAAIGNDTGPMHIIAAAGCQSIVLFNENGKPHKHAPQGEHVVVLQDKALLDMPVSNVSENLAYLINLAEA